MKIKLRDMTFEQYEEWQAKKCATCGNCIFKYVKCYHLHDNVWIKHKDLYSDKFLDQEIEIYEPILIDEETKAWLEDKIIPLGITMIIKNKEDIKFGDIKEGICLDIPNDNPVFEKFLKLESDRFYKIKDLIKRDNEILNLQERQYLRAVIKPFRKRVVGIAKTSYRTLGEKIVIMFENFETLMLPFFKSGTIYKGMQLDTPYTLEDLGL